MVNHQSTWVILIAAALALVGTAASANGAIVQIRGEFAPVPVDAVAAGVPQSAETWRFYMTTASDIVSIEDLRFRIWPGGAAVPWFYHVPPPFGSDSRPPDPDFLAFHGGLQVDTWVTTPGVTTLESQDGSLFDGDARLFDLTDDGPQQEFLFAQVTVPFGSIYQLTGRVGLADNGGMSYAPICYNTYMGACPEPPTFALLLVASLLTRKQLHPFPGSDSQRHGHAG